DPATTSMQRWTVPSPPQTKMSSAPSASARRTSRGAALLFGTSRQYGSSMPCRSSSLRSSSKPPPNVFPACAITAIFDIGRSSPSAFISFSRRQSGGTADQHDRREHGDSDHDPADDVQRVMHAAVHTGERDVHG